MEEVSGRICLRAENGRLIPLRTVLPAHYLTLGLLGSALFSALSVSGGSESAVNERAASPTNVMATPARAADQDSLERAWAEAIASAERLKGEHRHFPASATDGPHSSPGDSPGGTSLVPGLPPLSVARDQPLWAGQVTAVLPLFSNDPFSHGVAAGRVARRAAEVEECCATLDLKLSVADAYVNVLRATRAAQRAAEDLLCLASRVRIASPFDENGPGVKHVLREAQTALDDGRQRVSQARESLRCADTAYNQLLARPLTSPVSLRDLTPPPMGGDVKELTALAFQQRPELIALAEQTEGLRQEARSARPSAVPSLGMSGGFSHLDTSVIQPDYIWSLGVVGTWSLSDNGLLRQHARVLDDRADAVATLRAKAMATVSSQVRQALMSMDETRRRVEITRAAVMQAEANLKLARDHYHIGTGPDTEVLDAEASRIRSVGECDDALYDAVMAVFKLRHAIGNL